MGGANGLDEFRWPSHVEQTPLDTVLQGHSDELHLEKSARIKVFVLGLLARILGRTQATHHGHPDVQQQDVRLECSYHTQHLAAICGFADALHGQLLHQEPPETLP